MTPNAITPGARSATCLTIDVENMPEAIGLGIGTSGRHVAGEHTSSPFAVRRNCDAVSQSGKMTPAGYQPENHEWIDELTVVDRRHAGWRIGRDPMDVDPAVLTAAGHPLRETRALVSAKRAAMGDAANWYRNARGYSDIPAEICHPCSGDSAGEVRRCAIIDCPMWAYRTGRNPHSPRRGKMPANFALLINSRQTRNGEGA